MTSAGAMRFVIHGAKGRMGVRLVALAREREPIQVVAALDLGDADAFIAASTPVDAVIDFSSDAGAQHAVRVALAKRSALLVGTTALGPETLAAIDEASRTVPVLVAANTSLGVAVARHLVRQAASMLGAGFDADILERHHRHKLDAPSGTAKVLAAAVAAGGLALEPSRMHSIRAGDIIGEHTVSFCGPGEILEVRHTATSRDLFARGALTLASWLIGRPPGMHSVDAWVAERLAASERSPS